MPTKTNKHKNEKKRVDGTKLVTRILVLVLAVMMVIGTFAMAIMYGSALKTAEDAVPTASTALFAEDQKIRVGLAYGGSGKESFPLSASGGFSFGYLDADDNFTDVWQVTESDVSVACDFHLTGSGSDYSLGEEGDADVGGYHICLLLASTNRLEEIASVNEALKSGSAFAENTTIPDGVDYYAFPGMINGKYAIMVGDFSTESAANEALTPLLAAYPDAAVLGPVEDGVTVVSASSGRVLFDFQPASGTKFGVGSENGDSAVKYGSYTYIGILEFTRSDQKLTLISTLPLERYVECVLPYEISSAWPDEAQKAFSVIVRNYALDNLDKHGNYNFDMCSTTCCQVYRGVTKLTQNIIDNVKQTEGIINVYDGEIMRQWYSSSVGGTTVNITDVWGGQNIPYLKAIATPWEDYASHNRGSWTVQYTPAQLAKSLRSKGYTSLTGNIASITIDSLSENSTYVNKITITDTKGNKVTIKNNDDIRSAFSLYSGNFVVGKAGSKVTVVDYGLEGYGDFATDINGYKPITLMTASGKKTVTVESLLYALTPGGKKALDALPSLWIRNATDPTRFTTWEDRSLPRTKESGLLDFNQLKTVSRERTITLSGTSGNFVFVGRGWGHGVGASQYGYYDLAEMGYTWKEIISFYYKDAELVHYMSLK